MNPQTTPQRLVDLKRPTGLPFRLGKIGHVALYVSDIERSARFYTQVLGFSISDIYGEDNMPGGAVFLRLNADHHGIALFKATDANKAGSGLHHTAFEVATLDEVVRARQHLRAHDVQIDFDGRRRAGVQIAVEFRDPDGHRLEIYWGIDQIGSDGRARPAREWKGAQSLEAAIADPVIGQDTTLADPSLLRG
jgi:catechol 2,3-dioxygenase-like lactoylglutathione lyase family enzyme